MSNALLPLSIVDATRTCKNKKTAHMQQSDHRIGLDKIRIHGFDHAAMLYNGSDQGDPRSLPL